MCFKACNMSILPGFVSRRMEAEIPVFAIWCQRSIWKYLKECHFSMKYSDS